jgi:hypothetical protein
VISRDRKRLLMREVVVFASEVLARTADSCVSAAPSISSDDEDAFAREYLHTVAAGLLRTHGGAS